MKYICIKKCYWEERFWDLGDVVEKPNDVKVPEHFRPITSKVIEVANTENTKGTASPNKDEGSIIRETLKKLCGRNGITVEPTTTVEWMREQLSAKGIVVS